MNYLPRTFLLLLNTSLLTLACERADRDQAEKPAYYDVTCKCWYVEHVKYDVPPPGIPDWATYQLPPVITSVLTKRIAVYFDGPEVARVNVGDIGCDFSYNDTPFLLTESGSAYPPPDPDRNRRPGIRRTARIRFQGDSLFINQDSEWYLFPPYTGNVYYVSIKGRLVQN